MSLVRRSGRSRLQNKTGCGIVNSVINNLPFELHIPKYQYCGPGTKVIKRVARGDKGINPLDAACKKHDLAYLHNRDNLSARHKADYELEQSAWKRVNAGDSSVGEKAAAWIVTNAMKAKQRFGMGVSKLSTSKSGKLRRRCKNKRRVKGVKRAGKRVAFGAALRRPIRADLLKSVGKKNMEKDIMKASKIAIAAARKHLKSVGGKRKVRMPRIIPIPKTGGLLPLVPIFAGLSALGSLAGGAAAIYRAVKGVRNSAIEKTGATLQLSSKGSGLYLKPYRSGMGLFLNNKKLNSKGNGLYLKPYRSGKGLFLNKKSKN